MKKEYSLHASPGLLGQPHWSIYARNVRVDGRMFPSLEGAVAAVAVLEAQDAAEAAAIRSDQWIVVFKAHGQMNCETQYIGPFTGHDAAYEALCALPALGHEPSDCTAPGHKFVQPLTRAFKQPAPPAAEDFAYAPEACPTKHWDRGDGVCEDCGTTTSKGI